MISIKYYRKNRFKYFTWAKDKWIFVDFVKFDKLDKELLSINSEIESLQSKRNKLSKERIPNKLWDEIDILKKEKEIKEKEHKLILDFIPNPAFKSDVIYWWVKQKYYKWFEFEINWKMFKIVVDCFRWDWTYIIEHSLDDILWYSMKVEQRFLDICTT